MPMRLMRSRASQDVQESDVRLRRNIPIFLPFFLPQNADLAAFNEAGSKAAHAPVSGADV
jgi:hypothetical protein